MRISSTPMAGLYGCRMSHVCACLDWKIEANRIREFETRTDVHKSNLGYKLVSDDTIVSSVLETNQDPSEIITRCSTNSCHLFFVN